MQPVCQVTSVKLSSPSPISLEQSNVESTNSIFEAEFELEAVFESESEEKGKQINGQYIQI